MSEPGVPTDPPDADFMARLKGLGWPGAARRREPGPAAEDDRTWLASPYASRPGLTPTIAGFRIDREVGRGGMGVVFDAVELALGRRVALKVLVAGLANSPTAAERFRREARAAARLHHTNIVPVFGVGEDGGQLYYAMQFIEGEGLDRVIGRAGLAAGLGAATDADPAASPVAATPSETTVAFIAAIPEPPEPPGTDPAGDGSGATPPSAGPASATSASRPSTGSGRRNHYREVARIGQQVAEALAYAHKSGILHRDIKPSNILIDDRGTAWVADFGLAKSSEGADDLTETGDIVGTLRYMAPERFGGWSDFRGDVYSLGVTLREMASNQPLFREGDRARLIQRIVREEPPRPRVLDRDFPRDLETILLKATAKSPAARYADAGAMADDLRRFLAGEPILARKVGAAERAWRWARRNPAVASLLAMLATVLAVGFAAMAVLWARAEAGASAARASAENARRVADSERQTRAASVLQSARLELDTGDLLARQGRVGRGLLRIEQGLGAAPADAADLRRSAGIDLAAWAASAVAPVAVMEHRRYLQSFTLAPDGRTLAVGSGRECHLWDLDAGTRLRVLDTPGLGVRGAFTPDGRHLVTTSEFGGLRLWDVATGTPIRALLPPGTYWDIGGISPDGARVLGYDNRLGRGQVVALADGRPVGVAMAGGGGETRFRLSPDGSRVVSGRSDGRIQFWDAETGRPTGRPIELGVPAFAWFTPAGDAVVLECVGPGSGSVRVHDAATGGLRAEISLTSPPTGVTFCPDGRAVMIAEKAGSVARHDLDTGLPTGATIRADAPIAGRLPGYHAPAVVAPDGQVVATAHIDNTVRLWDAVTGEVLGSTLEHDNEVRGLAFRPDGRTLLTAQSDGTVLAWDVTPAAAGRVLPGRVDDAVADLSPDGRALALAHDGVVRLVDPATGLPLTPPMIHDEVAPPTREGPLLDLPRIRVARFSPDGRTLATGGDDGRARLWDVASGRLLASLMHEHWVLTLAFSPDGSTLATGITTNHARLWDVRTGEPRSPQLRYDRPGVNNEVSWVGFSPDGRVLATFSRYDAFRFWDARDGSAIPIGAEFPMLEYPTPTASPDGGLLLLPLDGGTQVWDVRAARPIGLGFGAYRGGFAFGPGGRRVVALGDRAATLWDVASRTRVGAAMEHPAAPSAAAFTPDGGTVVTGARDGTVRLWDVATGRPVGPALRHGDAVGRLLVTPDGRAVIAVGGRVTSWPLPPPGPTRPEDRPGLARRIALHQLDDAGDVAPLSPADWRTLGGTPASGPTAAIAFHDRWASVHQDQGRPAAAEWHLDRLMALRTGAWADHARRSVALLALGRPVQAAAAADRAEALAPPPLFRAWRSLLDLDAAREAIRAGRYDVADDALSRVLAARPDDVALLRRRVAIRAALGRWIAAEADSRRMLERAGDRSIATLYHAALLRLAVGDRDGYRDLCRRITARPAASSLAANEVAWISSLAPTDPATARAAVAEADRAAADPRVRPAALNTLGAARFRAGDDAGAIAAIEQGIALRGGEALPQDWVILALAHAHAGRIDEARRSLDRCLAARLAAGPTRAFEALEWSLWRAEATAAVRPDGELPADPFARE